MEEQQKQVSNWSVLDLHVIGISIISLIPALILMKQFGPAIDMILLALVVLFPQGRIFTQAEGYFGDRRIAQLKKFLLLHEAYVATTVALVVAVKRPLGWF